MNDAIEARMWADHGAGFAETVAAAFAAAAAGWKRLNALQFDAPWKQDAGTASRAGQA